MTDRASSTERLRRLRALLVLRDESLALLAERLVVSHSHLRLVILGNRQPSERLQARLRAELTGDEWRFVNGETEALRAANRGGRS